MDETTRFTLEEQKGDTGAPCCLKLNALHILGFSEIEIPGKIQQPVYHFLKAQILTFKALKTINTLKPFLLWEGLQKE